MCNQSFNTGSLCQRKLRQLDLSLVFGSWGESGLLPKNMEPLEKLNSLTHHSLMATFDTDRMH